MWRLALRRFLRLCLLIFVLRRFLSDPIMVVGSDLSVRTIAARSDHADESGDDLVEREFDDTLGAKLLELWQDFTHHRFVNDRFHGYPVG